MQWKSDATETSCEACAKPFNVMRRRHHCRSCGGLFCGGCSAKTCDVAGEEGAQRVCDECHLELTQAAPIGAAGGAADLRTSFMPSQTAFGGMGVDTASPLGGSGSKAPSWASELPGYAVATPEQSSPTAQDEPAPDEEIPPSPASTFAKAMFFYAVAETAIHSTFDLDHDDSDNDHIVGYVKIGEVVEALRTKRDEHEDDDKNVGMRVQLKNGWITQGTPDGPNIRRVRGTGEEVRRRRAEFEQSQREDAEPTNLLPGSGPGDFMDQSISATSSAETGGRSPIETVSSSSSTATSTTSASLADFDPMAADSGNGCGESSPTELFAELGRPRPPPNSTGKSVRIAPDTMMVERRGSDEAAREGLPIEVLSLTKQRGSERYAAELQWGTLGSQGSYRLLMKSEQPGAAAAAASGGMAVGAPVDIKRVEIVRMTCEGAGLQFSEQREGAAGTRATVVQILDGNGRARVTLKSGEVVTFPLKALELVPFVPAKWKKASKDPVSIDRWKKVAHQTVLRLKPGKYKQSPL